MSEKKEKIQDYQMVYTKKQQADSYDLWKICFGDTKEYMDNYFSWRLKENQIFALYDNEIMSSMIHLNPYPLLFSGKEIDANYIVGVATKPEYRKQGLMRKLLTKALEDMYHNEHEFTYLMPASDKIYLPFDFRYVYEQRRVMKTINLEDSLIWVKEQPEDEVQAASIIGSHKELYKSNMQIKVLDCNNQKELSELISFVNIKLNESQEIYAKRDEHYYKRLQADMRSAGGEVMLLYNKDQFIGSVSYMLEANYAEVTESIVEREYTTVFLRLIMKTIVNQWLDKEKLTAKVNEKNKKNQFKLIITFLESNYLDNIFFTKNGFQEERKPIIMARIVNLSNFMKHITAKKPLSIVIKVEDPIIHWNHGIWELRFHNEMNDKYLCEIEPSNETPELTLDIGTLTELFFGYKKVDKLDVNKFPEEVIKKLQEINFFHKVYLNEIV